MKKYKCLMIVILLLLSACHGEPSSEPPSESPSPPDIIDVSPPPSVPELPSETGDPPPPEQIPITPPPSPEAAEPWPKNEIVSIDADVWGHEYEEDSALCLSAWARTPVLTGLPDSVNAYYEGVMNTFRAEADKKAADALNMLNNDERFRPYSLRMDFLVECNAGGLISIRRLKQFDPGGIHYDTAVYCETFASDGRLLTLDDFFSVPRAEYLPVLLAQVQAYIEASPEDFFDSWKEAIEVCFPYDSFCVTAGGLSLFYQELSIAAYVIGVPRIDIPWTALEGIWKMP